MKISLHSQPYFWRAALALTLLLVAYLSFAPHLPGPLPAANDKVGHLLAFATLAFLTHRAWPWRPFGLWAVLPLMAYGVGIELVQWFLPTRTFSLLDMLADALGLASYTLLWTGIARWRSSASL